MLWGYPMLLKEIPGLLPVLNDSAITKSKLWNQHVENLHPAQLVAIRTKELQNNPTSNIDQEINYLVRYIQFAELDDLCKSPLSYYFKPNDKKMLTTEFIAGLTKMPQEYRLATIFGLEMKLSAIRTSNLTVQQAYNLENLTELATSVLRSTLNSIKTISMFWRVTEANEHVALDDLGEVIYEAYGMTWLDLSARYRNMVADHYNPLIMSA